MKKRVISAIVALIIVIPLVILGGYPYYAGIGLLSIIGFYEITNVYEREKKLPIFVKCISLLSFMCIAMTSIHRTTFNIDYRMFLLDLFVCLLPLIVIKRKHYDCNDAFFLLGVTMFLGIAFNFMIVIRNISIHYLLYTLLITISSDTFAHFFGTKIGKHKLFPEVSPNKTIEGFIGGTFFGTLVGSLYFLTFVSTNASVFLVIIISLALSIISACGDLVFSAIKRRFDVKDYGNIMPGHGGVLDRLDSFTLVVLAFSYLVSLF
jgi:phosphatidate cytidylyltransferase